MRNTLFYFLAGNVTSAFMTSIDWPLKWLLQMNRGAPQKKTTSITYCFEILESGDIRQKLSAVESAVFHL